MAQGRPRVTELSRRGGDTSGADVIVVAVLGSAISAALGTVTCLASKVAIDATNAYPSRSEAFRHKRGAPVLYRFAFLGEL